MALKTDDGGLLSAQPSGLHSGALIGDGEGASTLGSYGTTPTAGAYLYVAQAQAPLTASGGNVAALMAGSKWTSLDGATAKTIVTYSFADPLTSTFAYTDDDFQSTLSTFSAADRQLTRDLLAHIEAVCNVQFVEVADNAVECGVLRYGYSEQPNAMDFAGYAFFPAPGAIGGDIWIGANQADAQWDFYRPDLILHETLHALGLKHPFSSGAVLPTDQDIIANTVMSYSTVAGSTGGYMSQYPGQPMSLDIAALQYLYGASTLNAGSTSYDLAGADFQGGFHAVWDAGGTDTFDASQIGRGVVLDLNEGASSNVGVTVSANGSVDGTAVRTDYTATLSIAAGVVIENAVGSGFDDTLIGNTAANRLDGGAGNDSLAGRDGNDVLVGGPGHNFLDGGVGVDTAAYGSSRASYTIVKTAAGVSVSSAAGTDSLVGIERLSFSDGHLALDLGGAAGTVAKVIGAVFGADCVHNAQYVGIGLHLLDAGMTGQDLVGMALDCRLGADPSNDAVVDLLYSNLFGSAPAAAQKDAFVALLDLGALSQESLGQIAADHALNAANIDLVGLSAAGVAYLA